MTAPPLTNRFQLIVARYVFVLVATIAPSENALSRSSRRSPCFNTGKQCSLRYRFTYSTTSFANPMLYRHDFRPLCQLLSRTKWLTLSSHLHWTYSKGVLFAMILISSFLDLSKEGWPEFLIDLGSGHAPSTWCCCLLLVFLLFQSRGYQLVVRTSALSQVTVACGPSPFQVLESFGLFCLYRLMFSSGRRVRVARQEHISFAPSVQSVVTWDW